MKEGIPPHCGGIVSPSFFVGSLREFRFSEIPTFGEFPVVDINVLSIHIHRIYHKTLTDEKNILQLHRDALGISTTD